MSEAEKKHRDFRHLPWYLLLAAAILVGMCWTFYAYLAASAEKTVADFDSLEQAIISEDWDEALAIYEDSYGYWQRQKNKWQCLLRHDEIDDIEVSFLAMKGYLETKAKPESLSALYRLDHDILHIPDTEKLTLYNIF